MYHVDVSCYIFVLLCFMCLKKGLCRIVSVDEMQFGCMPERGAIDTVFIL